jgi:hypothetical protein
LDILCFALWGSADVRGDFKLMRATFACVMPVPAAVLL